MEESKEGRRCSRDLPALLDRDRDLDDLVLTSSLVMEQDVSVTLTHRLTVLDERLSLAGLIVLRSTALGMVVQISSV